MDTDDTPACAPHWEPPAVPPAAQAPTPLMRSRLALVAGAVGLVAVGGIGGFVLGQSSSATAGTSSELGHAGGPAGMNGGEGFPGQPPGGGRFPGGAAPGGTGTGDPTT